MDAVEVSSPFSAALAPDEELARQIAESRGRRRALLEAAGASEEVLGRLEALDRSTEETFLGFIADQASALRRSAERLHLTVEASDLGTWEYDAATGDRRWSRRCKELFGFPPDDSVVTQEQFISTLHPEDRPRWYAVVREAMDPEGEGRYRIEYRIVRPSDGKERWISATGRTQFDQGRPVRMFGTLLDVTERKRAEEDRELFLGMLGHDLGSPLSSILMGAELLMLEADPKINRTATRIASSGRRMRRMIDDLIEFARARGGQMHLQLQRTDLAELCRESVDDLALANPNRALVVEGDPVVCGRWDRDRLRQVIENLTNNALTHGSPEAPVRVCVRCEGTAAQLEVINEGDPIPEAIRPNLFDPFRRGTDQGRGFGLGLYIAREIVSAHGGAISASSADRLTKFSVVLPTADSHAGGAASRGSDDRPPAQGTAPSGR